MHSQPPRFWIAIAVIASTLLAACGGGSSGTTTADAVAAVPAETPDALAATGARLSRIEQIGLRVFNDTNLSEPRGLACVGCHMAGTGFANNNGSRTGVALGGKPGSLGLRNAMTNAYSGLVPGFSFRVEDGELEAIGGHFWDGRANTLTEQAQAPFLNPLEMNNPNAQAVIDKIARSAYAPLLRAEFGNGIFSDAAVAMQQVGTAVEAFERSAQMQPFTSKYDAMVRGETRLNPQEQRGMALFMDPVGANCAGCHLMSPTSGNPLDSPFSEFTYYATGIPRNRAIAQNTDPAFFDLGLCGPNRSKPVIPATAPAGSSVEDFCGKFRMVSLRNVALRQAFMHNGFFKDLREVVNFYSTRNSDPQRWYGPSGVPNDLPAAYLPNIENKKAPFDRKRSDGPLLSPTETDDLLAFLRTLNDGFSPPR